jgi:hypothetical protein
MIASLEGTVLTFTILLFLALATSCEIAPELCDANANVIGIISTKFIIESAIPLNKIKSPNLCTRQLLSI